MKQRGRIRQKVQRLVFSISIIALIISMVIGSVAMYRLQSYVSESGDKLGKTVAKDTQTILLTRSLQAMSSTLANHALKADNALTVLGAEVTMFAEYATMAYSHPEDYISRKVLPPDAANDGKPTMHYMLRSTDVKYEDVAEEMGLLANLKDIWSYLLETNTDTIVSIYMGTESGFMLIYDGYSGSRTDGIYAYNESTWYTQTRDAGELLFTDAYQDHYGHGLMVTCCAPFYKPDGSFAGVMCMDILTTDLHRELVQINVSQNSYTFLLDKNGNIIASPDMDGTEETFVNIQTDTTHPAHTSARMLLGGASGIAKCNDNLYFAYTPIDTTGWRLVLSIDAQDILEPLSHIDTVIESNTKSTLAEMKTSFINSLQTYLILLVAIAIVVFLLSHRFAKRLTKPLAQLRLDAQQIRNGNIEYRTKVNTSDEIGELANAFNQMTQSLQNQIAELTKMTAEKERIGAELSVATQIQISMLPYIFPAFPDHHEFDIYASMNPAKEVGGDFYDFYLIDPDHIVLEIADVSGKGVPAALFMAISKALLKSAVQAGLSAKQALESVNNQLCDGNSTCMFVTIWLGILDLKTGRLVCSNAGHEYPVIRHKDSSYELIMDKHGPALGVMESIRFREYEINLTAGDRLFVYTDGVPEATSAHEELFGNERMLAALNRHIDDGCYDMLVHMLEEINAFVGDAPQFDDITMLMFQLNNLK